MDELRLAKYQRRQSHRNFGHSSATLLRTASGGDTEQIPGGAGLAELDESFRSATSRDQQDVDEIGKALKAISAAGRRQSIKIDSEAWDHFMERMDDLEQQGEDGVEEEDDDHHHGIPFYNFPVQRQRWGESQLLPHINWGDLVRSFIV